ncbi:tetratricopeptide repeat protein [Thermogemmatispora onikobensis]|uniref:tetratricopeptide repeat protein n=1 Tax=Thermogemmatispora onikobensis TaxID=732234 RepID=UPI000853C545|nr:tetratricopeptide repeat protein [Thermogemmatispora onikobensis]
MAGDQYELAGHPGDSQARGQSGEGARPSAAVDLLCARSERLLSEVHAALRSRHVALLTGLAGSGKTTLGRAYVRHFGAQYASVIWLDALAPETLVADLLAHSEFLPSVREGLGKGAEGIRQIIEALLAVDGLLLVLDHATLTSEGLPMASGRSPKGTVLVLTQEQLPASVMAGFELKPLEAEDGATLLLGQAGLLAVEASLQEAQAQEAPGERQRLALEISRELAGSPLALTLAAGYLALTGCTLECYLSACRSDPLRLSGAGDRHTAAARVACHLLLVHLEGADPDALRLLEACALFACPPVPRAVLQQDALLQAVFGTTGAAGEERFQHALHTLLTGRLLSAVQVSGNYEALELHPLLRELVLQALSQQRQVILREAIAAACLCLAEASGPPSASSLALWFRLAGHIREGAAADERLLLSGEQTADAYAWAASLLGAQAYFSAAESLLRRAVMIWEQVATDTALAKMAGACLYLGVFNAHLQRYTLAERYAQRALTITQQLPSVPPLRLLDCITTLAWIYEMAGRPAEARRFYQRALAFGDTASLRAHPLYLAAMEAARRLSPEERETLPIDNPPNPPYPGFETSAEAEQDEPPAVNPPYTGFDPPEISDVL